MSLLVNPTPWTAEALPFVDDHGRDGHLVVVKVQYAIDGMGALQASADIEPLIHGDRFDGDGPRAPLLRPADVMAPQPATNVLLLGHAYAPGTDGVRRFEPWLGIDRRVFPMRIHGIRHWRRRRWLTRALTLFALRRVKQVASTRVHKLPLTWQHAFGGVVQQDPDRAWPQNPAGTGYQIDKRGSAIDGTALPAAEDPRRPIRRWDDRRVPQMPGAVSPHWSPRVDHGGTRDSNWQRLRAPALPEDGTAMFHNTAHPALQFEPHLVGGEPIHAEGFRADQKPIAFDLPTHRLIAHSYHYGGFSEQLLPLNSVILEPDANRLTLLYRCFVPQTRDGFDLRRIALGSVDLAPPGQT